MQELVRVESKGVKREGERFVEEVKREGERFVEEGLIIVIS